MQLIDTHSHLYLDAFKEDIESVLTRAEEAEIGKILLPAIDWVSLDQMEQLHHDQIEFYRMMGIHPCEVDLPRVDEEEHLLEVCSMDQFIGVGETGLDYYWSTEFIENQKESLRMHCRVAKETGKPIVLHNRDATDDLLKIISDEQDGRLTGVWHCFTGTEEEGKRTIDLGLHLGVGGVATFKNAGVGEVVSKMPLEKLILETDAPYLSPAPKRGKRNEPAFMRYTAEKLADLKEQPLGKIAEQTSANAIRLFNLE